MRNWIKIIVILALGEWTALFLVFLGSPRFWPATRIITATNELANEGKVEDAIALLDSGARWPRAYVTKDALLLRACELSSRLDDLPRSIGICNTAAAGPKRTTQAQAWLFMARIYSNSGLNKEAMQRYRDIREVYWDYSQAAFAEREMNKVGLTPPFLSEEKTILK